MTLDIEIVYIILMTSGVLFWTLGGYRWKWMRRALLPAILMVGVFVLGISWWQSILVGRVGL